MRRHFDAAMSLVGNLRSDFQAIYLMLEKQANLLKGFILIPTWSFVSYMQLLSISLIPTWSIVSYMQLLNISLILTWSFVSYMQLLSISLIPTWLFMSYCMLL
jgi:hypothetical protein